MSQKLEHAKKVLEQAKQRATDIQVELKSARQQYQRAAEEALREHGTDSLPKLREKLTALEQSNETAVTEFCRYVAEYERHVSAVEAALANPAAMAAFLASLPPEKTESPVTRPAVMTAEEEDI